MSKCTLCGVEITGEHVQWPVSGPAHMNKAACFDALRASLAAAEAKLADERARYEALVGAVDPGPCPCCGDNIHAGHSLDCTFADDCPEEARAWDRVHEAIAANAVPAASLAAHDAGVLERAIEAVRGVRGLYEPNASGFKACELVEVALKAQALAAQAQAEKAASECAP